VGVVIDGPAAGENDQSVGVAEVLFPSLVPITNVARGKGLVATIQIDDRRERQNQSERDTGVFVVGGRGNDLHALPHFVAPVRARYMEISPDLPFYRRVPDQDCHPKPPSLLRRLFQACQELDHVP
jgi:hypothetical protein